MRRRRLIDAAVPPDSTTPVLAVMLGRLDGPVREGSAVPSFSFPEPAAAVLGRMWAYRRWLSTEAETSDALDALDGIDVETAATTGHRRLGRGRVRRRRRVVGRRDGGARRVRHRRAPPTRAHRRRHVRRGRRRGPRDRLSDRTEVDPTSSRPVGRSRCCARPARRRRDSRGTRLDARQPGRRCAFDRSCSAWSRPASTCASGAPPTVGSGRWSRSGWAA